MGNRLDLDSPQFRLKLIETLIQSTPVGYIIIDRANRVRFVNDYFLRFRKLERADVLGEICYEVSNDNGEPCSRCIVRDAVNRGQPTRMLRKDILCDGGVIYSDDFAIPIKNEETGNFDYVLEIMIDRTKEMKIRERNSTIFLEIISAFIKLLEKKNSYTCEHSRHVSIISAKLTEYYGLGEQAVFNAALGGLLHDLGKLYIPDSILNKNEKLNEKEYAVIREHPMFTWLLLTGLTSFNTLRDIAIAHHERWDGKGYPGCIKGQDIPIEAKISAVADAYDAMTSNRPYRDAISHEAAIEEIKKVAGLQFDPNVVDKFVQMVEEFGCDRDALITPTKEISISVADNLGQYVHQTVHHKSGSSDNVAETRDDAKNMDDVMLSDSFIESVFNNTPAFYTLVDESFNVLYASENLVAATGKPFEELIAGKCFDLTDKKMTCFLIDNGSILCPVIRALTSGKEEYALVEDDLEGQKLYFDVFAIPIDVVSADGEKIKCCLEIMFDRTREKTIQYTFENDLKQLIAKIRDIVDEIVPEASLNVHEIIKEANDFSQYLDKVKTGLSELVFNENAGKMSE